MLPTLKELCLVVLTAAVAILFAIAISVIEELPQNPQHNGDDILWKN